MLLAIDIGNSNIVFGVHNGNKWIDKWRIHSDIKKMPDEYGVYFHQLLSQQNIDVRDIRSAIISSVVPQLTARIQKIVKKLSNSEPLIVGPGVKTGLTIRTDNPNEVGADLVANAVAAWQKFKTACVIIDFGTALSFTAVSGKGEFLGAAFMPGIYTAADSLSGQTAQLPRIWLRQPPKTIGTNTSQAMQSGIVNGYIGAIEHILAKMKAELDPESKSIATGGSADIITALTGVFDVIDPWLTLEGLKYISHSNKVKP
jgi:type III pantothenate kinase